MCLSSWPDASSGKGGGRLGREQWNFAFYDVAPRMGVDAWTFLPCTVGRVNVYRLDSRAEGVLALVLSWCSSTTSLLIFHSIFTRQSLFPDWDTEHYRTYVPSLRLNSCHINTWLLLIGLHFVQVQQWTVIECNSFSHSTLAR